MARRLHLALRHANRAAIVRAKRHRAVIADQTYDGKVALRRSGRRASLSRRGAPH